VPAQAVLLRMPDELYHRLEQRAVWAHRSVEEELLDVITAAVETSGELPHDLAEALAPMALLDDQALWRAARSHLDAETASELETLNMKQQREGLLESEDQMRRPLLRRYERAMLVRAQAAALLKERGHDVAELFAKQ
jgi:plasmid stability protein